MAIVNLRSRLLLAPFNWAKGMIMVRRRSSIGAFARGLALAGLGLICFFAGLVALYDVAPPISTLMLGRMIEGKGYERKYVALKDVSPIAVASVIVSEDTTFCQNDGVDWDALREVLNKAGENGPKRGASTITMQTAKNLFLWPGRSTLRKGVEIGFALVLGRIWSKARTAEIYLNVAEWGDGLFGIEAAAQHYFHKNASELDAWESALLATSLPNPIKRDAAHPRLFQRRLAASLVVRTRGGADRLGCVTR